MTAFFKQLQKTIIYSFISVIVIAALAIAISPLFSPLLQKRLPQFEKWASDFLGMSVTIQSVNLSWYRYYPEVNFNQIAIANKGANKPALQLKNISLFFSIPKSLWERKLFPVGIMVKGTNVKIIKTEKGEVIVDGFSSLKKGGNDQFLAGALGWVTQQPYILLRDIHLKYEEKGKTYSTKFDYLNIENHDRRHHLDGQGVLLQKIPTHLTWSIAWQNQGQKLDLSTIKAKGYISVTGLSLTQWLKEKEWKGWQINSGIANAKIWGVLSHGKFRKLQSFIKLHNLTLFSQKNRVLHKINGLSGNFGWKRENKQYVLAGEDVLIDLPHRLWPTTHFYMTFKRGINDELSPSQVSLGYVNLGDIFSFLRASPSIFADNSIQQKLDHLELTGILQNTGIQFADEWTDFNRIIFNTNFSNLSFSPWQDYPGVKNLSGKLKWNQKTGEVNLNSIQSQFQYDRVFANSLNFEKLIGAIQLERNNENGWFIRFPELQIANGDVATNVKGTLSIPEKGPIFADVKANFVLQNAKQVTQYLPLKIFPSYLDKWLNGAFLAGDVREGRLELRGPLNEFPFDNNNGIFFISGIVNNIDLNYAPDWPLIKHIFGKLVFSGSKMGIYIDRASIQDIPIKNVNGEITDLNGEKAVLQVESKDIQTDFSNGLQFIHDSPLEKSIGKMLEKISLKGPIHLGLLLNIPLGEPDKTEVKGNIDMKEATLDLVPWNLNLHNMNGKLLFTEKFIEADKIKAILFNKPITFSLGAVDRPKDPSTIRASFEHHLDLKDLETWLKLPFSKIATGSTDIKGDIDLSSKNPVQIHLHSDLKGVSINLPDEYSKNAEESKPFDANLIFPEKDPWRFQINYGDQLSIALLLNREDDKYHLIGANLHFGTGFATWPQSDGLYITGEFANLSWDKIKSRLDQSSASDLPSLKFKAADISAKTINIFGQTLNEVSLETKPENNNWNVNITSNEIVGQIKVPMKLTQESTVIANLEKLHLKTKDETQKTDINIELLPSISFIAKEVEVNDIPLGEVAFKAISKGHIMSFQSLRMLSTRIDLQAIGNWTNSGTNHQTHLKGVARSSRVSQLLDSLGINAKNFVSNKGQVNFDLTWQNPPFSPIPAELNGKATLSLGPGRIVDVGQSSAQMGLGRMLSIFSLQSIPRRLSLNFSDLFQKGYSFDSIGGDFSFKDGNAYTENLRFDGPVASVSINGRIGLKEKDYQFTLSAKTYVTSGLPLAATLLTGNPLIGLGALAVNSMIGSQMSTYTYHVTGPWDNPKWQQE